MFCPSSTSKKQRFLDTGAEIVTDFSYCFRTELIEYKFKNNKFLLLLIYSFFYYLQFFSLEVNYYCCC